MANAVAGKRGRGDKSAVAVVAARLALAEQLLAEGCPRPTFIERFREQHPSVDLRTIDRYRSKAWQAIRVRREAERAHDVETRLHRLTYLSHKLETEGAYAPMMRAEQLLAQITGVLEAEKHLHLHAAPQASAQAAPPIRYPDMPVEALDALEAALQRALATQPALPAHEEP
jgi:hypothetical protein